jgi:hypothetical protein
MRTISLIQPLESLSGNPDLLSQGRGGETRRGLFCPAGTTRAAHAPCVLQRIEPIAFICNQGPSLSSGNAQPAQNLSAEAK